MIDLHNLLRDTFELPYFTELDDSGEPAIPYLWTPGTSKLVLVLGENASGKSVFRRIMRGMTLPHEKDSRSHSAYPVQEFIGLSMQARATGGIVSSMLYGTEDWNSTGYNSAYTVTMGIKTAEERKHSSILYWDEPDIGMGRGAAAGAGQVIAEYIPTSSPLVQAVFLTSHSRELIAELACVQPHYVYLGDANGPATLDEWLTYSPRAVRPEKLAELGHYRHRRIQALLNNKKK